MKMMWSKAFLFLSVWPAIPDQNHLRHANVNNQTRSLCDANRISVTPPRTRSNVAASPGRLQKVAQGILHCFIIVDDCNQFWRLRPPACPEGSVMMRCEAI